MPWRRTTDPYAVLVSEIMLQQTQVKTVVPYWQRWMQAFPSVAHLAGAEPEQVLKLWEGLGYYTRARNLKRAAEVICREHGGRFPRDYDALLSLPGIGRYTAGAVCSITYNDPVPVLDGNVIRVLCRVFGLEGDPRAKAVNARLWELAAALVEQAARLPCTPSTLAQVRAAGNCSRLNQALMELGAVVCTPKGPRCPGCPLKNHCEARHQDRVDQLPALAPRPKTTRRHFLVFVAKRRGRLLVRQRPGAAVNGAFWEFPNVEVPLGKADVLAAARELLPGAVKRFTPLGTVTHSITRYRLSFAAFLVELRGKSRPVAYAARWLHPSEFDSLPVATPHRKILKALG